MQNRMGYPKGRDKNNARLSYLNRKKYFCEENVKMVNFQESRFQSRDSQSKDVPRRKQSDDLKLNIAHIMKAGRLSSPYSQTELAKALSIPQSRLSRYEGADSSLGAHEWMSFCEIVKISPQSLRFGFIDRCRNASLSARTYNQFDIPKRFSDYSGTNVRAIAPFLNFLRKELGYTQVSKMIHKLGIDPAYFVDYDNRINMNFIFELFELMLEKGLFDDNHLRKIASSNREPYVHGKVHLAYDQAASPFDVIQTFVQKHKKYTCDYQLHLFHESRKELIFSVTPQQYLSQFDRIDSVEIQRRLCRYIKYFLLELSHYKNNRQVEVTENSCRHEGGKSSRCLYAIRLTG